MTLGNGLAENAPQVPDRHDFLQHMRLVPGPVAIIACSVGGNAGGLVATAWNSLSADPPMLLACVNRSASAHDLIAEAGAFSINLVPTTECEAVAVFSGQRGLRGNDRFTASAWSRGPMGQPLFEKAIVAFECAIGARLEHGTHSLLVGKVGYMRRGAEIGAALLYLNGAFMQSAPLEPMN